MAVKIRLKRLGKAHSVFYRLVALDSRKRRDGAVLEELGWYKPISTPKESTLKTDRIQYWIGQGAQISDGATRLLGDQGIIPKVKVAGPKLGEKRRKAAKLTKAEKRNQAEVMVKAGDAAEATA